FIRGATQLTPSSGAAWAATANAQIGTLLQNQIGRAAVVGVGCTGTNGQTRTNTVASISVAPVLTTGVGNTTAFGNPDATNALVKTTATIDSVRLLGGVITIRTVNAVTQETFDGSTRTRSTVGSGLIGAKVLGIAVTIHANTDVALPGFGHVIFDEEIIP